MLKNLKKKSFKSKRKLQSEVRDDNDKYCSLVWQGAASWLEENGGPGHLGPPSHPPPHPPHHPRLDHLQDR